MVVLLGREDCRDRTGDRDRFWEFADSSSCADGNKNGDMYVGDEGDDDEEEMVR